MLYFIFTAVLCVCVFRYERLEEQLNDLTELHQNEMTNLKQELASMEEKVAYQSYERARDIQVTLNTRQGLLQRCFQVSVINNI